MGATLEIIFLANLESFINFVRGFSNPFDFLSISALSCVFRSGVYGKFQVAVCTPPLIGVVAYTAYQMEVRNTKTHVANIVVDSVSEACWNEAQTMAKNHHAKEHCAVQGWVKKGDTHAAEDFDRDTAATKIQAVFRGKQDRKATEHHTTALGSGGMKRHQIRHLMMKRAVKLAVARQNVYGWAFLAIFIVYPSVCSNILAVLKCFRTNDASYIAADFGEICPYEEGGRAEYFWAAALFGFAYPIGIPTAVAVVIFRHRKEIKRGFGPSQYERLYDDYKPEHCLWEIYQLLQKVLLVGFLGFIARVSP